MSTRLIRIPTGEFKFPPIPSVICGMGSVQQIRQKLDEAGAKRALVITGRSLLTKTDLVERIKHMLGERCAGLFSGVIQHVPRQCIIEGARIAKGVGADILISLGGGSAADSAKGINLVLSEAERIEDFFTEFNSSDAIKAVQFKKPKLGHIAIPTTLSGAEFRSDIGITDMERKCKDVFRDVNITPKVVILDPEVTAFTPKELWGSTGLKNLSDCFMNICSREPLPFVTAISLHSIQVINQHIVLSVSKPLNMESRAILQHAAWMGAYGVGAPGLGIIAALRHQIGGMFNVPHGIASTIIFPHCISFSRPIIDEYLMVVAKALGLSFKNASDATSSITNWITEIISEIGLPTRLRDVGVPKDGLKLIAKASMESPAIKTNIKPINSKEQLVAILEKAW